MPEKIYIRTYGCQMNVRDSEIIRGMLEERGYTFVDDESQADVVIYNTCSVREHAEHRAISSLGSLIKKDKKQKKIFGLIGCVAQHKQGELFKKLPRLKFICGPSDIYEMPRIIRAVTDRGGTKDERREIVIAQVSRKARPLDNVKPVYRNSKTHAFVNITYGCDNYCSYCIVPYVRGPEVSRPVEDVVQEVRAAAKQGIAHITLLGQNVNSYRSPARQAIKSAVCDFVGLLKEINKIEGIKKISFMTSHPKDASKELFQAMADLPKIDRYLHLPMQSGSNRILKLMNRGYTIEKYRKLIEDYRQRVKGGKLSTDIIVGFPTETEEDFEMTKKALEAIRFNNAYIFKYSPRPPAKSAELADDVPQEVKARRHKILLDLQKKISRG